ncbi:sensor histidine kinase, partial [Actinomyces sp. MRS3W]|uniref:sensor histidine kinase n=1 Tax=Actinomyces sp. MRS3W TaxID=2800796 RepID=UPI0028FD3B68
MLIASGAREVILLVCCLAVAARRLAPGASVAAIGVALSVHVLIFDSLSIIAVAACLVAVETCTSRVARPWAWGLLALGYVGSGIGVLRAGQLIDPDTLASRLMVVVVAWALVTVAALTGLLRRRSRERVERALERANMLAAQQRTERQLAVIAERHRIARDVHDVLGHSLSIIGMQAEGARAVLATDPAAADEALAVIGTTSRQAVDEVRSLVDVLRADDVDTGADPVSPTRRATAAELTGSMPPAVTSGSGGEIDAVVGVVSGARRAGLPVRLSLVADADPSPGVGEAVYRLIQEALTNVVRHADGAATTIELRVGGAAVDVVVENAPAPGCAPAAGTSGGSG